MNHLSNDKNINEIGKTIIKIHFESVLNGAKCFTIVI